MPSIRERTGLTLNGFEPVQNPVTPPSGILQLVPKSNPMIRTPLPPIGADPDSLRQFDETGPIPTRRVIPLPVSAGQGGGSTTVITNVIGGSTAGGGGGTTPSTTPTLSTASLTLNVPALAAGANFQATVTIGKAFQLLRLIATQALECRIYGSTLAQGADIARSPDTSPAFETTSGLISDVILDTIPYQWQWQNRIGANSDPVPASVAYITVINPSTSGIPASTLTLIYLPLVS